MTADRNKFRPLKSGKPPLQLSVEVLESAKEIECQSCGGMVFHDGFKIKRISEIMSPNGMVVYTRIPFAVCVKCGEALPQKP